MNAIDLQSALQTVQIRTLIMEIFMKEETPKAALPVGVILTLSATGSEMSSSSVITNTQNWLKARI